MPSTLMAGGQGQASQADRTRTGLGHSVVQRAAGWGARVPRGEQRGRRPLPPAAGLRGSSVGDTGCALGTGFRLWAADFMSGAPGSQEKPGTAQLLWVRPQQPGGSPHKDDCPPTRMSLLSFKILVLKVVPITDTTLLACLVSACAHTNQRSGHAGGTLPTRHEQPAWSRFAVLVCAMPSPR